MNLRLNARAGIRTRIVAVLRCFIHCAWRLIRSALLIPRQGQVLAVTPHELGSYVSFCLYSLTAERVEQCNDKNYCYNMFLNLTFLVFI